MIGSYGLKSFGRVAQVPGIRNEFIHENAGCPRSPAFGDLGKDHGLNSFASVTSTIVCNGSLSLDPPARIRTFSFSTRHA